MRTVLVSAGGSFCMLAILILMLGGTDFMRTVFLLRLDVSFK